MTRPGLFACGVIAATVAATFAAPWAPAWAETPEERQACMDSAFQFCGPAIPDQDRVFQCLLQNKDVIAPLCRTALTPYLPPEPTPVAAGKPKAKAPAKAAPGAAAAKGPLNLTPSAAR
jgi:hypothetical protein